MGYNFLNRHIGPSTKEEEEMLAAVGCPTIDELMDKTVPKNIRLNKDLDLPKALSEYDYLQEIRAVGNRNSLFKSYIGMGYYNTIVPPVIQRNVLENPGWYTAYTPYQAEIAQGRLEGLLNFQTMVSDLTGMELANASLLDEATAAAEAMTMFFGNRTRQQAKEGKNVFMVSDKIFPQTIEVLKTRATPVGIDLLFFNPDNFIPNPNAFGLMIQYPDLNGEIKDYKSLVEQAAAMGIKTVVSSDLMALTLVTPPGEWGADAVVGNTQRFGVPMGFGGPHAAFFATREEFKRFIPGRIIGVSVDSRGQKALRMALQTREQHIKRDKATSNICTAQALLANMASMYAVFHGPKQLRYIAHTIHHKTAQLAASLKEIGYKILTENFFDTLYIHIPETVKVDQLKLISEELQINLNYLQNGDVTLSLDETTSYQDLGTLYGLFAKAMQSNSFSSFTDDLKGYSFNEKFIRKSTYLTHEVFNTYHSETEMMRYLKRLENKDFSLTHSMISLGSCTMKLNSASELYPITDPNFANLHPFAPVDQTAGYKQMIDYLNKWLSEITGFDSMTFQPNSGAQGEYTGLMVIRKYQESIGQGHRNIALIPVSAHGTNPASAVMCGLKVVVVNADEKGNIDVEDLRNKAELYKENLSALMVTYPSTHGVFESSIVEITEIIHKNGGQVYMDGANMNAQVGLTNPASIGADVCHLNLHKTFAIPHGGGGPGVGPIGVREHLTPFLPNHSVVPVSSEEGITAVSAAPYGSALILLISYAYIRMLGAHGLKKSTEIAILNANYIKSRLEDYYPVLYTGENGTVAHEMIIDCRSFVKSANIEVADIAKRLIDYGFHAPTVSFPVPGTMMIEPTESESKRELDRFCDAMIKIREEIKEIEQEIYDRDNNVLKNAPHTADVLISDNWNMPYSREKAAYPLQYLKTNKLWPSVGRVDNAHGDRNLICTCPPVEDYKEELLENLN